MFKIRIALAVLFAAILGTLYAQQNQNIETWKVPADDPVSTVGHGGIWDAKGREIEPSPEFVIDAQRFYLKRLYQESDQKLQTELKAKLQRFESLKDLTQQEQILVNSALIAWLIDAVKPRDAAHLASKNGALRNKIFRISAQQAAKPISKELLRVLDEEGLIKFLSATTAGGAAYIQECLANGVPTPPDWGPVAPGRPTWTRVGSLSTKFIVRGQPAEVYVYESREPEPDGICLALPRYAADTSSAPITALGIICLGRGRERSRSCFWDNVNVTPEPPLADITTRFRFSFEIRRGESVPLSRFAGGADLFGGNGVCSDCHAGNNPFIVHPGDAMDLGSRLLPRNWPEPMVDPRWPQNPGPTTLLEGVPRISTDRTCLECHNSLRRLQFPEVSTDLRGYCMTVLRDALGIGFDPTPPIPPATMPQGDIGNPNFQRDINALITTCSQRPIRTPLRVTVNGATQSIPSGRIDQRGDFGVCTGGDCPYGFCYWRTLHGPFWQRTDFSVPIGSADYRGSFLRIYAEGGQWKWHIFSDPGGQSSPAPGGTAECMIFRNITGVPDPNNCFSAFATIVDPTGTRLSDSVDATVAGVTTNVLTGYIGNVAQAAFGIDGPDTLRVTEEAGRVLLLQRHTDSPPAPFRIGPLKGECWANGCNRWTPNYAVRDVHSESDVQLVSTALAPDVFCFITGITGAWSSTRSGGTLQPYAEIYNGTGGDIRLRVFPRDGPDRVGAYASCVRFR